MEYCSEIAVLHGAFALVKHECSSGKYDLLQHSKGDKTSRQYTVLKDAVQEIIKGPETPRGSQGQKSWSRRLHQIFFCKSFIFNTHCASKEETEYATKVMQSAKALCQPIPDFHPHLYFELLDEFQWCEFLGESLAAVDLPTALNFTTHCLSFCRPEPSLFSDLHLLSSSLDHLVSSIVMEIVHVPDVDSANKTGEGEVCRKDQDRDHLFHNEFSMSRHDYEEMYKKCMEQALQKRMKNSCDRVSDTDSCGEITAEHLDKLDEKTHKDVVQAADQLAQEKVKDRLDVKILDSLVRLVDLLTDTLALVEKRMSTKLFDRNSCRSGDMGKVLHILGHILASVVVLGVVAVSTGPCFSLRECLRKWICVDEDDKDVDSSDITSTQSNMKTESVKSEDDAVNLVAETLADLASASQTRSACLKCLASFFLIQPTKEGQQQKLSTEKSIKFGRVMKLRLCFSKVSKPLQLVTVVQDFAKLLAAGKMEDGQDLGLRKCVSSIVTEVQRREKIAEEKRLNPSLSDVMDRVQNRTVRWKWHLQFGLAKRDLKDWWFAGFLEFLFKHNNVLETESDVQHLMAVMSLILHHAKRDDWIEKQKMLAELILKTFTRLPVACQEKIILDVYKDKGSPPLSLVTDFDQSLTVTFNKLSAGASQQDLHSALRMALHDLLTFTKCAVKTAISNRGQIAVVGKVLQLIPEAMRSDNPLYHPQRSLLCHCLHTALLECALDATEEKNMLILSSSLVKTHNTDAQTQPLLSPAEFLTSCVLPFISFHSSDPPISIDFALRLLIGCLDATLSEKHSDWLEEVQPAVIVACCAGVLQECSELVGREMTVDRLVTARTLVIGVLGKLQGHFLSAGKCLEASSSTTGILHKLQEHLVDTGESLAGHSLKWLQDQCTAFDWTVCAYLSWFLAPHCCTDGNKMVADFAAEVLQLASWDTAVLLRVSATSDVGAAHVVQAVKQSETLHVSQGTLVASLQQVLPHCLGSEVSRVVQVLMAMVSEGHAEVKLRPLFLWDFQVTDLPECHSTVLVSQLLLDAMVVMLSQQVYLSPGVCHHLCQVYLAALQELLQKTHSKKPAELQLLYVQMFCHVCVVMTTVLDVLLDTLFVVLLDLLSKLGQLAPQSCPGEHTLLYDAVVKGISLIPRQSLQDTLKKKMEHQG